MQFRNQNIKKYMPSLKLDIPLFAREQVTTIGTGTNVTIIDKNQYPKEGQNTKQLDKLKIE